MHIQGKKEHPIEENHQFVGSFFPKTNLLKEWMEKFIALLTKGKEKAAMNEWKTDYSFTIGALHNVTKN